MKRIAVTEINSNECMNHKLNHKLKLTFEVSTLLNLWIVQQLYFKSGLRGRTKAKFDLNFDLIMV